MNTIKEFGKGLKSNIKTILVTGGVASALTFGGKQVYNSFYKSSNITVNGQKQLKENLQDLHYIDDEHFTILWGEDKAVAMPETVIKYQKQTIDDTHTGDNIYVQVSEKNKDGDLILDQKKQEELLNKLTKYIQQYKEQNNIVDRAMNTQDAVECMTAFLKDSGKGKEIEKSSLLYDILLSLGGGVIMLVIGGIRFYISLKKKQ